ncbi:MAG TPA: Calx-beta domain-containing protein [Pyrinomonadaceae bacterium]|nr:Calx-beta domain-containing protein [Pyrinomonadaceae bacterium]
MRPTHRPGFNHARFTNSFQTIHGLALATAAKVKSSRRLIARKLALPMAVLLAVSFFGARAHMQESAYQTTVPTSQIVSPKEVAPVPLPASAGGTREPVGTESAPANDFKFPYSNPAASAGALQSMLPRVSTPLAGLTGTKTIPGDYATLALAITDLNTNGVGAGGVTFSVLAPQTAPAGGYVIGGAGSLVLTSSSAANPITFTGNGNTITAFNPQTVSNINDGIIKLIGADFVTIQGFTLQENPANTIIATGPTNNATEFGIGLFYVTVTDGAQNNTIQNNTITMNRAYANTFCIFSTTRASATAVGTTADATTPAGTNSNTKIYSNNLSNTNYAIVFLGSSVSSPQETGTDIGGSSIATGNTITNVLTGAGALSTYVTLTGNDYAIFLNHQINDNVSFNSITSAALTGAVTVGGFLKNYSAVQPTGTITTTINNNTVTITNNPSAATTGGVIGINNQGLTPLLATATMSINNNTVQNCVLGGSTSTTNGITAITNLSVPGTLNMTGNTVLNNAITATTATTGIMGGITNSGAAGTANITGNVIRGLASTSTSGQVQPLVNSGVVVTALNLNNNQLGNASGGLFSTSTATSGTLFGIVTSGGAATCALSIQNNDIRGITYNVSATAVNVYFQNSAATLSQNISNNTWTNLNINTTGNVTFISDSVSLTATGTKNINNNQIVTGFNRVGSGGTITLYNDGASSVNGSVVNNNNNNFSNMSFTGTTTLGGWFNQDGLSSASSATKTITGNTFNNITGGTGQITALSVNFSGPSTVTGNTISNITSTGAIIGLNIGSSNGQGTHTYAANTISNLTSNSPGGGVNGIQGGASTIPTLNVNNNSISALSQTGGANQVNGIILTAGTVVNAFKNKIANLQSDNAGASINGIALTSGTTYNIYNNLVGDLRLPSANAASPLTGILVSFPGTANVYYNTVYLNATSSGALFGSAAISASSTTALTLRNNIFVNTSVPNGAGLTVAYSRTTTTLTTYNAASNNNDFFAGTPGANRLIFSDGTNTDQTLVAYQARVTPRDAASVSDLPPLNTVSASAQFLHLTAPTGSGVFNGGAAIPGFVDDYDGDSRDASTPEIGADEVTTLQFSSATYTVAENEPATFATITVTRSAGNNNPGTVDYNTTDGTANGIAGSCSGSADYVFASGTLNFTAGQTSSFFTVPICNDAVFEPDETVNLTLTNATGSLLGSPNTAVLTITNDEATPVLNVTNNPTVAEGNAGPTLSSFNITLSPASATAVTVHYSTQDDSATVTDNDYVAIPDTLLTFNPGDVSKNIDVTVNGDTNVEPNEQFFFNINNPLGANISDNQGIGTITNDDVQAPDYTVTTSAAAIVVTDVSNNGDTLTVSEPGGGQIKFAATGRFFSVNGGPVISGDSGNLLIPANSITIDAAGGDDIINVGAFTTSLPSLAINGGTGDDTVNFNGNLTFDPIRDLSVDFLSAGTPVNETINVAGGANLVLSGTGPASLKASRMITFAAASKLQVQNGNLVLEANQQATPTVGNFTGVDIDGGTVQSTGSGNISINGKGGQGAFDLMYGVRVFTGGKVLSTGTGTITVQGTGGARTSGAPGVNGTELFGVYVYLIGSEISSTSGAMQITGQGGVTNDTGSFGVVVAGGKIQTSGAGTLTINGTGGVETGGSTTFVNSEGVLVTVDDAVTPAGGVVASTGTGANAGNISITGISGTAANGSSQGVRTDSPGAITTVDGSITITGTSAACGNACLGTSIRGPLTASGTGAINITGTGAASTGAFPTHGVNVRSGGNVATASGNITITGTGGNGADNAGFNLASAGAGIVQSSAGNITATADIMKIGPGAGATISAATSAVTLKPLTALAINLGSAADPTGGPLGLSDAELDRITNAGTINIGNINSDTITVSAPITRPTASNLVLTSGAHIDLASSLNSNGGDVTLLPTGNNNPLGSGVDVTTSATKTLTLAAFKNLTISISSTTVDTGYTQLNVAGLVNLNNAQLALSGPYVPVGGETFRIVNNDSNDPITGTFNNLPQNAVIPNFLGSAFSAKISYTGGDGNDADLTIFNPCPGSFTVNSFADAGDANLGDAVCATNTAVCTLRAAIQEANFSPGACGTIDINFSIPSSMITVISELQLNHNLRINGPTTASIQVTGTAAAPTRIFNVMPGRTVTLSNFTVAGGRAGAGAGLLAQGPASSTTLIGMLFAGNTAIDPAGVAGGGGAATINGGTLNVINSTFSANTGTNGGGLLILGGGPLNLINSTVTSNNADGNTGSGGCSVDGDGGGIGGPTMPVSGISLRNSIVAGNSDCNNNNPNITLAGGFNDLGNNLTSGNPLLGPLQSNGGPTFTHALLALSPAIDTGNDCVLTNACIPAVGFNITTDQRGQLRPGMGSLAMPHVDIGAYEKQAPSASASYIDGHISDSAGLPVAGVAVHLSGSQTRLTVTDENGNYRFDEVEPGGFFVVTPARANFHFEPSERSFSQQGEHTSGVFTAIATRVFVNPLDTTEYFVRQQYVDFLNREPDEAGLSFWVNNIESCGADARCRTAKREDTSAAFFLSIEFRGTGYLVYRTYQSAFGEMPGAPVPLNHAEFNTDSAILGQDLIVNAPDWQAKLEANKQAYLRAFVARSRFASAYAPTLTPAAFVDRLFVNAGVTPDTNDRDAAIGEFGNAPTSADTAARARALRRVAENSTLDQRAKNKAFVLMQYFGYLGRDPNALPDGNYSGYEFWLNKLNEFDGDFRRAEMVKAFLVAGEYRSRFQ